MRIIHFTKARIVAYTVSLTAIAAMFVVTFAVYGGFNLGIDFRAGLSVQVEAGYAEVSVEELQAKLSSLGQVQVSKPDDTAQGELLVFVPAAGAPQVDPEANADNVRSVLNAAYSDSTVRVGASDGLIGLETDNGVRVSARKLVKTSTIEEVRAALSSLEGVQVQATGDATSQQYIIRVRDPGTTENFIDVTEAAIRTKLMAVYGLGNVRVGDSQGLATNSVGARFSQTLATSAIWLVSLAMIFIMIYIWIRFKLGFAIAAMVATLHDGLFMAAFIGVTQMEFTSATIAAVLTIIGYSLNDTIVVFDRIRENEKLMADKKLSFIYDSSLSTTMSRTVVTSFTTLVAVISIAVFTQGEVKDFAIALVVGILVGTYSSIFIASGILLDWRNRSIKRRRLKESKISGKPLDQIQSAELEMSPNSATASSEVDADALADDIRRQRKERKKF